MDLTTTMHTAEVILPLPMDHPLTYRVPADFVELVAPGVQVIVPLGHRYEAGIVLKHGPSPADGERKLKAIHDVVDPQPFVADEMRALVQWIAGYYICHLGEAYRLLHPSANFHKSSMEVRRCREAGSDTLADPLAEVIGQLDTVNFTSVSDLEKRLGKKNLLQRVHRLRRLEMVETRFAPPAEKRVFRTVDVNSLSSREDWPADIHERYSAPVSKRYQRSRDLIDFLQQNPRSTQQVLSENGFTASVVRRLQKEGIVVREAQRVDRVQEAQFTEQPMVGELSDGQKAFIARVKPVIEKNEFRAFLLHGITGSGKTQIYIELIREVVARGQTAIVLIPEIVLTPQTVARFRNYFDEKVAVIHSRLSTGERLEVLQKIREGRFSIVVGPRSAIFAPFSNLGIIVVDEEHESSYKQSDSIPRYHARDVALYRAHLNNIPVILGSATPSLESLHNALGGKYEYYHLASRISARNLPRIQLVDFKAEWRRTGEFQLFSENMLLKLESRILCREQSMLLQNRRGYAPYILCSECGYVAKCQNCDITLTFHLRGRDLRCHYCGHRERAPDACPGCRGLDVLFKGVGTQKIEEMAGEYFPYARMLRMDQDTTRRKGDHSRILQKFRDGKADFLIGTKMIAKGLDFERVTLVGILNADQGLHFPDFRAAEKVFQLLVQAAGRAGRGVNSGEVVIQTFDPQHYIFKFLMGHDYVNFYKREIKTRETLGYPPYSRLCLVRIVGEREDQVHHYAQEIAKYLWRCNEEKRYSVLGPAPSPLARINNRYRYQVLIKQPRERDPSMSYVRQVLREGLYKSAEMKKWPVKLEIDIDPIEIL